MEACKRVCIGSHTLFRAAMPPISN